jgi:hypothetical protein
VASSPPATEPTHRCGAGMSTPFAPDHLPLIASRLGRGRCHRSRVPSPTGRRSRRPNRRSGSVTGSGPRDNRKCRSDCQSRAAPVRPFRALHNDRHRPMMEGRTAGQDDQRTFRHRATTTASRWSSDRAGAPTERRRERFQRRPPSGLHSWGATSTARPGGASGRCRSEWALSAPPAVTHCASAWHAAGDSVGIGGRRPVAMATGDGKSPAHLG